MNFKNKSFPRREFFHGPVHFANCEIHFDVGSPGVILATAVFKFNLTTKEFRITNFYFRYDLAHLRYNFKADVNTNPIIQPEVKIPAAINVRNIGENFQFTNSDISDFKIEGLVMKFRKQ